MPRHATTLTTLVALFLATTATALSQSVRWEPAGGSLAKGQVTQLQLVFENCQPANDAPLPNVPGLELHQNGSISPNVSISIINGRASQTQTLSVGFNARPTTDQHITIPSFQIKTDKGPVTVPAANFEVGAATAPAQQGAALTLDQVANSKFTIPATVYAGEVFPLTYTLTASKRFINSLGSDNPDWNPLPLTIEPWPKYQVVETLNNGERWVNVAYNTRAIARAPSNITLSPARQGVNLVTGTPTGLAALFGQVPVEQYTITSDTPRLTVKPLPAGAPASFAGAVGTFTLESKVVPATAAVGEPVTWTLTLAGTGNWPDITALPPRSVSKDFRAIQPALKRTPGKDNALFDATLSEDVVLIPTQPGTYTLGPVQWSYFDPAQSRYITITTPATTVTIASSANAAANPFYTGPAGASGATPTVTGTLAASPKPPGSIPGDPLPAARNAATPLPHSTLALLLIAVAFWPLLLWLVFALLRARRNDPNRPQREARARLAKTLAALDETPTTDRARTTTLIQQWQRDTATLWRIPQPVPTAADMAQAAAGNAAAGSAKIPLGGRREAPPQSPKPPSRNLALPAELPAEPPPLDTPAVAWTRLWSESERALYRSGTPLPDDWSTRAHDALAATRVRGFNPLATFRLRNLFPLAAAFVILFSLFTLHPSLFGATNSTSPEAAYKSGNFPTAETAWRKQLATAPTDWVARHNLSLALAQQDRWAEAAAQAVVAFVQHPNNAAVRRNVVLALTHAGYAPAPISEIMQPGPVSEVALRFSPARWQCFLGISIALAGIAFALLLVRAYTRRWRNALLITACLLFVVAVLGTVISVFGLHAYGPARDARAVIVWKSGTLRSIPTVADTTQKTTPLPAGTIAITDKSFPGWVRLVFDNGQTGWVPKDDTVALWK